MYVFKGKDSGVSFLLCNPKTINKNRTITTVDRTSMFLQKCTKTKPILFSVSAIHEILILTPSLNIQMYLLRILKLFSLTGKMCYSVAHKYFGCSCRHSAGNSSPVFYCSFQYILLSSTYFDSTSETDRKIFLWYLFKLLIYLFRSIIYFIYFFNSRNVF